MESIFGNCYVTPPCMNYKELTSAILFQLNWYATFNAEWTIQMVLIVVDSFCRILQDRNLNFRLVNQVVFIFYDAVHCFCLTRCILALSYLKNPLFVFKMPMIKESFWIKSFQKGGGRWGRNVALKVKISARFELNCWKYINMYFIHSRTSNI